MIEKESLLTELKETLRRYNEEMQFCYEEVIRLQATRQADERIRDELVEFIAWIEDTDEQEEE